MLAHHLWTETGAAFLAQVQTDTSRLADLPALMIYGAADRFTSDSRELPRMQQLFPRNEAVVIPGAGHFFPESAPDAMTAAMQPWLART